MTTKARKVLPEQGTDATFAWDVLGLAPKVVETSSQTVNQEDMEIVRIELEDTLCFTCLERGREVPSSIEHGDLMYCATHNPVKPPVTITVPDGVYDLARTLPGGRYVMDLETTGLNPRANKVITIAFGTPEQAWIIDMRRAYAATAEIKRLWCDALQALFHRDDIEWAGHNLKFDWSFMAAKFGVRMKRCYDTMLVEQILHNEKGTVRGYFRLDNTAQRYGLEASKQARNWFIDLDQRLQEWQDPLPASQIKYIAQDIVIPSLVIQQQEALVKIQGLTRVVEIEHAVLPVLAAMEVKGIAVDVVEWRAILAKKKGRRDALEPQIKRILGEALASRGVRQQSDLWGEVSLPNIDLGSTSQLKAALKTLGITVESTESDVLKKVKDEHEVIPMILEWKGVQKFITSFGESVLQHVDSTGHIHANFRQLGAVSGRITCTDPGLQIIPKPEEGANLRKCFIAPPGTKMLVADLSNIELRIIADFSQDPTMLRFFDEGKDLHAETARIMFHLGPDVDTKKTMIHGKRARDIAKTINFGIAYGQKAGGLAESLGISRQEAQEALDVYIKTYSVLAQYLDQTSKKSVSQGYTTTPSGRRRDFTELELSRELRYSAINASKNHPIQGTGADILKRAMTLLYAKLPQDVSIIHAVHDEIIIEAPIAQVDVARELLGSCMLEACKEFLPNVAVPPMEVSVADYWVKD
jgi:DNA polymerase I